MAACAAAGLQLTVDRRVGPEGVFGCGGGWRWAGGWRTVGYSRVEGLYLAEVFPARRNFCAASP